MFLPEEYPKAAPKVHFMTKVYFLNVDRSGKICLYIVKDKWSIAPQIPIILLLTQALLSVPNSDDPLANDVVQQ